MQNTSAISRKESSKQNVEWGDPILLSESSRSKVLAIPFYIRHSDHTELSIKIQTLRKANPPLSWIEIEEKSATLKYPAIELLASELPKLIAVSKKDASGDYLVIRMEDGTADLGNMNPEAVTKALLTVMSQDGIAEHFRGKEISSKLAQALRYSVRLEEMKTAMAELRINLDDGVVLESVYQKWCESHPWAFGNQFVVNDAIRNISTQDTVDILMPRILAGYRDIIELKRPDMTVLQYDQHHRDYYFSSDVSKAIGQCHRYLDVFSKVASDGLLGNEQIVAYHPEATIVIGRSADWDEAQKKALHGLNSRLSGISVITYDHLLAQGECLVDYLSSEMETESNLDDPAEDFPF